MSRLEPREALRSLLHSMYQCRGAEELRGEGREGRREGYAG